MGERNVLNLQSTDPVVQAEDQGQVVHLRNVQTNQPLVDDQGQPVTITVAGTYSKIYRRALAQLEQRSNHYFRQHRGETVMDPETAERYKNELLASGILAWSEIAMDGSPFPCTRENAIRLMETCPWIRDQVEATMGDHASFFKNNSGH